MNINIFDIDDPNQKEIFYLIRKIKHLNTKFYGVELMGILETKDCFQFTKKDNHGRIYSVMEKKFSRFFEVRDNRVFLTEKGQSVIELSEKLNNIFQKISEI